MVTKFDTDKRLWAIDAETCTHEHSGSDGDATVVWQEAEDGHEDCRTSHAHHAHAVTFALEDVVGSPTSEQGAHDTSDFKRRSGPGSALDVKTTSLGQEFRTPVEHAHTHYIHKEVGNTECPNPTVFPYHFHFEFLASLCALLVFVQAAETSVGKVGQTHFLRLVAQADEHENRSHHCQASRSIEAPLPRTNVRSVGGSLFHSLSLVHTIGGEVFDDGVNHTVGLAHVGTHCAHNVAASHHSESRTDRV